MGVGRGKNIMSNWEIEFRRGLYRYSKDMLYIMNSEYQNMLARDNLPEKMCDVLKRKMEIVDAEIVKRDNEKEK